MNESPCPFCLIRDRRAPATILADNLSALVIEPLNPVTEGHVLVIPYVHVSDFTVATEYGTGPAQAAMHLASWYADKHIDGAVNLITSKGREATQSVFHLHLHLVPRAKNDGLALPWYSGKGGRT